MKIDLTPQNTIPTLHITSKNKKTIKSLAKSLLVLLSLGTAHYIGFLIEIPFEILSIISLEFLASFVALFVFYLTLSYIISRVFSFAASQAYYSASALLAGGTLTLKKFSPSRLNKASITIHKETPLAEKISYWIFMTTLFPFVFNFTYLKLNTKETSQLIITIISAIVISAILKTGIILGLTRQIKRIIDKRRVALRRRLLLDYTYLIAGSALAISFYTGHLRYEKITHEERVYITHKHHTGWVRILMKSGNSYLLIDDLLEPATLTYINTETSIKLNDTSPKN